MKTAVSAKINLISHVVILQNYEIMTNLHKQLNT